jgi:hypothetical protein
MVLDLALIKREISFDYLLSYLWKNYKHMLTQTDISGVAALVLILSI